MFDIRDFINKYGSSIDEERKGRRKDTNEVFTPFEIVEHMCEIIPVKDWSDPEKTFLEPTFGNGNIICYIVYKRIINKVPWDKALNTLYGIELMPDNVKECKERVIELFRLFVEEKAMAVEGFDEKRARQIMDRNLVCSDFFDWDIENWKPIRKETAVQSTAVALF